MSRVISRDYVDTPIIKSSSVLDFLYTIKLISCAFIIHMFLLYRW